MNETSVYDSNYYDPTVDKILAVVYFMLAISVLFFNSLEVSAKTITKISTIEVVRVNFLGKAITPRQKRQTIREISVMS
jgi:hypothetical protein